MEFRYYQLEAVDAAWVAIHKGDPALVVVGCGGGKSIVIAELARRFLAAYPESRILILAHVKELVAQDAEELQAMVSFPLGVYCQSLRKKTIGKITVASIKSIYKLDYFAQSYDLLFIDEVDLVNTEELGQYRHFIERCKHFNKEIGLAGFTATPFRLKGGNIYGPGELFPYVCYKKGMMELIREGFLTPLSAKHGDTFDASGLKIVGKEYAQGQLSQKMSAMDLVERHVEDIIEKTKTLNCVLIFAVSLEHCLAIRDEFRKHKLVCEVVVSDKKVTSDKDRDRIIAGMNAGRIKYTVNVQVLTVGTNIRRVDCIVDMRPTKSKRLFMQILGRGTRLWPGKLFTRVISYSGNFREHGRLEDLEQNNFSGLKRGGPAGNAPVKECPKCDSIVHASALNCPDCDYAFPKPDKKNEVHAFNGSISDMDDENFTLMEVRDVTYKGYTGRSGVPVLKVTYFSKNPLIHPVDEYICLQHTRGDGRDKAVAWWKNRTNVPVPNIIADALLEIECLKKPLQIVYKTAGKINDVIDYTF